MTFEELEKAISENLDKNIAPHYDTWDIDDKKAFSIDYWQRKGTSQSLIRIKADKISMESFEKFKNNLLEKIKRNLENEWKKYSLEDIFALSISYYIHYPNIEKINIINKEEK